MNKIEEALAAYSQFEKDVKTARDQYEELSEMYSIYKQIEESSLKIVRLGLKGDNVTEGKLRLLQSEINVLQDNLKDLSNEYDERYDATLEIEWPIMGEAYTGYMDERGWRYRELDYIHKIVIDGAEMPEKPEMES